MTRVFHDTDAPLDAVMGKRIAIIGYGNQGRAWAQNLRDSGLDVRVGTVADSSRKEAEADGFQAHEIPHAVADADVICLLIPDEVILPDGIDIVLVAPRMIGVGVRDSYENGEGFIAFVGVERDTTGDAWPVTLGIAHGLGAT